MWRGKTVVISNVFSWSSRFNELLSGLYWRFWLKLQNSTKTLRFGGSLISNSQMDSAKLAQKGLLLSSWNPAFSFTTWSSTGFPTGRGGGGGGENRITYCALFKWSLVSRASFFQGSALGFHYYISYQPIICKWLIPDSETYNVKYINYTDRETKRRRGNMEIFPKDSLSAPEGGAGRSKKGGGWRD